MHECKLKRHNRDKHNSATVSTSLKPKKRRNVHASEVETMEIDDPEITIVDAMDVDETTDMLLKRSKMWDDKIKKKAKKEEEEEKRHQETMEKAKRERENKEKVKKEAIKVKRLEMKIKKKIQKKKLVKVQLKPYLKELPTAIKNLIGDGYYLYPV